MIGVQKTMKTILFQGDSITDGIRNREAEKIYAEGLSYPNVVSANVGFKYPGEYRFINRGVSGNRIVDVYARIKSDIINLKPDYMSLLIGVNDVWHELERKDGVDALKFERIYTMLIEEIKAALPELKMFILLPYILHGEGTDKYYDEFAAETAKRREAAKRVAEKFGIPYADLQAEFDAACEKAPADYWLLDGVHPDSPGSGLIADVWCREFEKIR